MVTKYGWKSERTNDDFENIEVYLVSPTDAKKAHEGLRVDFLVEEDNYSIATVETYPGFKIIENTVDKATVAHELVLNALDYESDNGYLDDLDLLDIRSLSKV